MAFHRQVCPDRPGTKMAESQKDRSFNQETFGAYYLGKELFIKRYLADPGKAYPDMGASFEMFTNPEILELETLGPLTRLAPGATLEHAERWTLHMNGRIANGPDATLDPTLPPL